MSESRPASVVVGSDVGTDELRLEVCDGINIAESILQRSTARFLLLTCKLRFNTHTHTRAHSHTHTVGVISGG